MRHPEPASIDRLTGADTASADAGTRPVPVPVGGALGFALALVVLWVSLDVATSPGQWGDHFEQFIWAHSIEWGYHKHPPLPTWLLAASIEAFGPGIHRADLLAALCTLGTACFTYRIACRLLGHDGAVLAIVLWGLQQPFSTRASLYNHNTVLMLCISGCVWAVLRALAAPKRLAWWFAAGGAAGLAILSKYQAVVPLAGILAALFLSGDLAAGPVRRGVLVAALCAVLLSAPHFAWVAEHQFTTLAYAAQQGHTLAASEQGRNVARFFVQQGRLASAALLFAALLILLPGPRPTRPGRGDDGLEQRRLRAWMIGLVGVPLALTALAGPLLGLELQNHWGYQALQFGALWLAWRLKPRAPAAGAPTFLLALATHGVFIAIAVMTSTPAAGDVRRRFDIQYPAREIAEAVGRDWRDYTRCPMELVVGPPFEAGMISVYSGGTARVLEDGDFAKSPWIHPDDLRRLGAVHVATDPRLLPARGSALVNFMDVAAVSPAPRTRIYWAIVTPETCNRDK